MDNYSFVAVAEIKSG